VIWGRISKAAWKGIISSTAILVYSVFALEVVRYRLDEDSLNDELMQWQVVLEVE
jgi:hypothetical protein